MRGSSTAREAPPTPDPSPPRAGRGGAAVALARYLGLFPIAIADASRRRDNGAFLLANGRGAALDPASALAREPFLAVAEITGTATRGRIVLAAPITLAEIEARFADRIASSDEVSFDAASASLRGRRRRRLGALIRCPSSLMPSHRMSRPRAILGAGVVRLGLDRLPWSKALRAMARSGHVSAPG